MIRLNNTQYFHFLQQADALRRSGSLCDAVISVSSQTFRAHRLVLACASRRLAQQLAVGDAENPVHFTLDYFSPHTFQQILDFTYAQTLEVSQEDLRLLLRAAQLLEMKPLEDQCQKQLDNLHYRERSRTREITRVKKEEESAEQRDEERKERPARDEKVGETSPSLDKACESVAADKTSPSHSARCPNSPQYPRKKARSPPASDSPYHRESVITRSAGNGTSFSSPWTFPNMWSSSSTLRRLAENYPNLLAVRPLPSPNPSPLAYPFPLTAPHVFPFLGSHFQSSVKGYSDFHSGYTQNLYGGSVGIRHKVKQGLLKRKKQGQRALTGTLQSSGLSFYNVPTAGTEREKDCNKNIHDDPVVQKSAPVASGEACARCHMKGSGDAAQAHSHPREHGGEKPYQCQHCPKRFSLKHQLDTHHRVHTGEKPFECRLCGQRSRDYSAMIKHLRTHGGASPYQCNVCREFCSSLVAMQRHVKNHEEQDFPPGWSISNTYLYISHI